MALFDNFQFGITPEFKTSPEVQEMYFPMDLSPLASLINVGNSKGTAMRGAGKSDGTEGLMEQKYQLDRDYMMYEKDKEGMVSLYQQKLGKLLAQNIPMDQAMQQISSDMQKDSMKMKLRSIELDTYSQLHKRNLSNKVKDERDPKKVNNATFIQSGGGWTNVGYDKNNKVTTNRNEIITPMMGGEYIEKMETSLAKGQVYKPLMTIDPRVSENWFQQNVTAVGHTSISNSYESPNNLTMAMGKVLMSDVTDSTKTNQEQLDAAVSYMTENMPPDVRIALENEYLIARGQGREVVVGTKKEMDEKTKKERIVPNVVNLKRFENFDDGFKYYVLNKAQRIKGKNLIYEKVWDKSYQTLYDGNKGNGSGGEQAYELFQRLNEHDPSIDWQTALVKLSGPQKAILQKSFDDAKMKAARSFAEKQMHNKNPTDSQLEQIINSKNPLFTKELNNTLSTVKFDKGSYEQMIASGAYKEAGLIGAENTAEEGSWFSNAWTKFWAGPEEQYTIKVNGKDQKFTLKENDSVIVNEDGNKVTYTRKNGKLVSTNGVSFKAITSPVKVSDLKSGSAIYADKSILPSSYANESSVFDLGYNMTGTRAYASGMQAIPSDIEYYMVNMPEVWHIPEAGGYSQAKGNGWFIMKKKDLAKVNGWFIDEKSTKEVSKPYNDDIAYNTKSVVDIDDATIKKWIQDGESNKYDRNTPVQARNTQLAQFKNFVGGDNELVMVNLFVDAQNMLSTAAIEVNKKYQIGNKNDKVINHSKYGE